MICLLLCLLFIVRQAFVTSISVSSPPLLFSEILLICPCVFIFLSLLMGELLYHACLNIVFEFLEHPGVLM